MKALFAALALILMVASGTQARVVGGVDMPERLTWDTNPLILNGAGIRVKKIGPFSKDIYVAGLYLTEKSTDPAAVITADEPMALRIFIVTSLVSSEQFTDHTRQGFTESTQNNTDPIQKEIDDFLSAFADEIDKGDLFDIVYTPGVGITVYKNQCPESRITVPGLPIKSALFGIWLGNRSEENLRLLARHLMAIPEGGN